MRSQVTSALGPDVVTSFATAEDGTRICWTSQGSGEAILLAMGANVAKEFWWRVTQVMAREYRVLTFDNRGFGETAWNGVDYTMRTLADDAMTVLDAAGIKRAHVYGVSLGGVTAQEIAVTYPDRVISLILGCTMAKEAVVRPRRVPRLVRVIPWRLMAGIAFRGIYAPDTDRQKFREDVKLVQKMNISFDGQMAQNRAFSAYVSRVRDIRAPTLVIHGTADKAVPYEVGMKMASMIPGARVVTLEGAGHVYMTDATRESNQAVLDFLAANRS